ncbi:MAG: hypothetical protein QXV16_01695 [Candidatus Anstonellales archaeon]
MVYRLEKSYSNSRMIETMMYDEVRRRYIILYIYDYEKLRENTYLINRSRDRGLKKSRLIFFVDHVDLDDFLGYKSAAHYTEATYDLLKDREPNRNEWIERYDVTDKYIIQEYGIKQGNVSKPYIIRIRPNESIVHILDCISDKYSMLLDKIDIEHDTRRERLKTREKKEKGRYIRIVANVEKNRLIGNLISLFGSGLVYSAILGGFLGADQASVGIGFYVGMNMMAFRPIQKIIYPISHPITYLDPISREYYREIINIVFNYIEQSRNGDVYVHIYAPEQLKSFIKSELRERIKNLKS